MHGGDNSFVRCGLFGEIKKKRETWSCWVPPVHVDEKIIRDGRRALSEMKRRGGGRDA
jgi:hypothetical protein